MIRFLRSNLSWTMASVPLEQKAGDSVASEGLVTSHRLENYDQTPQRPDEGAIFVYDENAVVTEKLFFAVAPKAGIVVRLKLDGGCVLDDAALSQLSERVKEVAEKRGLGPIVGEAPGREYPLEDAVKNTKVKNPRDTRIWDAVMSVGGARGGAQLGIFIRRNNFGHPQDVWAACITSVSNQVFREYQDKYAVPSLGKVTYKDLVGSRPYKQLIKATRRNANHMLAEFLIELNLIDTVGYAQDDRSTQTTREVHSPRLNKPEVDCVWNAFARMPDNTVGFYSEAVPRKRCHRHSTLRILHPAQGLAIFGYDKASKARDPGGGHALTPKRSDGAEAYDRARVARSYVAAAGGVSVERWVEQQNLLGVNARALSVPSGATCHLYILEPVQVLVA